MSWVTVEAAHARRAERIDAFLSGIHGLDAVVIPHGTCAPGNGHDPDVWSDPYTRRDAIALCEGCPALDECLAKTNAMSHKPRDIVQAGLYWSPTGNKPTKRPWGANPNPERETP